MPERNFYLFIIALAWVLIAFINALAHNAPATFNALCVAIFIVTMSDKKDKPC